MSPEQETTKIKATVYYWPDANEGLGHIACSVHNVANEPLYITTSRMDLEDELEI